MFTACFCGFSGDPLFAFGGFTRCAFESHWGKKHTRFENNWRNVCLIVQLDFLLITNIVTSLLSKRCGTLTTSGIQPITKRETIFKKYRDLVAL